MEQIFLREKSYQQEQCFVSKYFLTYSYLRLLFNSFKVLSCNFGFRYKKLIRINIDYVIVRFYYIFPQKL